MLCHLTLVNADGYTYTRTHTDILNTIVSQPLLPQLIMDLVFIVRYWASRAFDQVNYINMFDILLDIKVCPLTPCLLYSKAKLYGLSGIMKYQTNILSQME